jgi:Tfp pilus assembly protein PilO
LARLPYFFFLAFLMVCYIGYGYYTQKTMKELYRVREEVEELRSEYITTKSELMFKSKRSEVVEATKRIGLEESTEPPEKIVVEQKGR